MYEDRSFYELCDRNGIMVWQDFALACCRYPQSDSFIERIRLEVESVVKKFRNHSSLVIWCGDNEWDGYLSGDDLPNKPGQRLDFLGSISNVIGTLTLKRKNTN